MIRHPKGSTFGVQKYIFYIEIILNVIEYYINILNKIVIKVKFIYQCNNIKCIKCNEVIKNEQNQI